MQTPVAGLQHAPEPGWAQVSGVQETPTGPDVPPMRAHCAGSIQWQVLVIGQQQAAAAGTHVPPGTLQPPLPVKMPFICWHTVTLVVVQVNAPGTVLGMQHEPSGEAGGHGSGLQV